MSFVTDQVRRIDALLDRIQLSHPATASAGDEDDGAQIARAELIYDTGRISELQALIKSLSPAPGAHSTLVPLPIIRDALHRSRLSQSPPLSRHVAASDGESEEERRATASATAPYEAELEWLLVSKATAQVYGQLLRRVLAHTVPLRGDIDYWDGVLDSQRAAALYAVQTAPLRLWALGLDVYQDVRRRAGVGSFAEGVQGGWREFYALVRQVVRERSVADVRRRVVSPLARIRAECGRKRERLKALRSMNANALGVLLGEGLSDQSMHKKGIAPDDDDDDGGKDAWKGMVAKSIALMDAVLAKVTDDGMTVDAFDGAVGSATEDDRFYRSDTTLASLRPQEAAERLGELIETRIPHYQASFEQQVAMYGRPSPLVRYWFPATVLLLSSGTMLRITVNRKEAIVTWIQELGVTVRDFWANWVVEPLRRVIGTIRHDEGSEVSIMSRRSLEGDRESLERMVVGFVQKAENTSLSDAQLADIKAKVKEGDLTPILKAYEKDMQSPFMGAVRGNLVQTLLIQIQKTKVDVEVAMGGVDQMLKSQELLFGLLGLTPGVLICVGTVRWLNSTFGSRQSARSGRQTGQLLREVRNIDRILTSACPTDFGELLYKDQGLLLCEVHLLRQDARKVMPKRVYRDFLEDVDELVDIRIGVKKQQEVMKRIRWAYAKWLQ